MLPVTLLAPPAATTPNLPKSTLASEQFVAFALRSVSSLPEELTIMPAIIRTASMKIYNAISQVSTMSGFMPLLHCRWRVADGAV